MNWAPFEIAEYGDYAIVTAEIYPRGHDHPYRKHPMAVLFDDDTDRRVYHALACLLYANPLTLSRISAVEEHKGMLTVWAAGLTPEDAKAIEAAAGNDSLHDYWSVEHRQLWLPTRDKFGRRLNNAHLDAVDGRASVGPDDTDDRVIAIDLLHRLGWWAYPAPPQPSAAENERLLK